MSTKYPTIDLTDNPQEAQESWSDLLEMLRTLANLDLVEHLGQIKMLEIGCGRAEFLRHGRERGVDIVGVDQNIFTFNADLPIHQADIELGLPFPEATFNLLYARGLFDQMHRLNQDQVFRHIQRVMKPGALFAIEGSTQPNFEIAQQYGLVLTNPPWANYYSVLRKIQDL